MSNKYYGLMIDDTYLNDDEASGLVSGRSARSARRRRAVGALARSILLPGSNAAIALAKQIKSKRAEARKNKAIVAARSAMYQTIAKEKARLRKYPSPEMPEPEPQELPESEPQQMPEPQIEETQEAEPSEDMAGMNKKVVLIGSAAAVALLGYYAYTKGWLK